MLFKAPVLSDEEKRVIQSILEMREALKYAVPPMRWSGYLRRNTFAQALRGSTSIEGYVVSVEDAIAAAAGQEPLNAEQETWAAIMGYRQAMTYVLQLSQDCRFKYNEGFIRSLHYMMLSYDLTKHPGNWRPGPIYVRDDSIQKVVYEGPEAEEVPTLMAAFVESLNDDSDSQMMVQAAMAHLNLAMIHPFSDGNGRMARCVQTLVLAREGILEPMFCSIEEYLGKNTREYYDVLSLVGQGSWHPVNDTRPWIRFNLTAHYRQAKTLLRRNTIYAKLWDELERMIGDRGLQERMIFALADAAMGFRVRNATYRVAAEVSDATAGTDLKTLAKEGLLLARGQRRGRYYEGSDLLKKVRKMVDEPQVEENPFEIALPETKPVNTTTWTRGQS